MSRIAALPIIVLVATSLTLAAGAAASDGTQPAAKAKVKIKVVGKGQKQILKRNAIKVRAKGLARPIRLRARSKTFDSQEFKPLSKRARLRPGKTAKLRLSNGGRGQLEGCTARTIEIRGKGAKASFELRRNSSECKPKAIDLSRAETCDLIGVDETSTGDSLCMLPFPDDFHTVKDESTGSGRRVQFTDAAMPHNSDGDPITAEPYNLNDGFSPGQAIVLEVPGLQTPEAFEQTGPVPLNDLGRYEDKDAPVIVIDAETGERWPIWVELDSNATEPENTALLVHPARNFDSGHRYVIAMRKLRDGSGTRLAAPEGFRYYRDDLPVDEPVVSEQGKRFENLFRDLRRAKIKRKNLYLAWDFTVSTDENIAGRLLHIRDDAFGQLGDADLADGQVAGAAPQFQVTSVQELTPVQDPEMARRIQGTFEVPCYLSPNCDPGGTFDLGPDGLPSQTGTYTADFNCFVPRAAVDAPGATPGRPQVYGHGLLGSASQATSGSQQTLGQAHNFVVCATTTIGFSEGDVGNIAANILTDLGNFPQLTDRVQQGLLNTLFLGRLMITPDGFVSDDAFHVDPNDGGTPPVIDTSRLYYNGNSQGGILGGAATAVAPDWTRATLGVPGMNYSVLLNRSVDFDTYKLFLDPAYPDPATQQLALSLIQMLWDRSEPNGYAHRMTDDPLPNTPPHEVLLHVAFGDHQVTSWQADVEARTLGAPIHQPVVYDGRWPGVDVAWGIDPIESYPHGGSAIVYWDSGPIRDNPLPPPDLIGTDPPPLGNIPNRTGEDPHSDPRVAPEEMQMVSDFLRPDAQSQITDTCGGQPCYAGGFTGP